VEVAEETEVEGVVDVVEVVGVVVEETVVEGVEELAVAVAVAVPAALTGAETEVMGTLVDEMVRVVADLVVAATEG